MIKNLLRLPLPLSHQHRAADRDGRFFQGAESRFPANRDPPFEASLRHMEFRFDEEEPASFASPGVKYPIPQPISTAVMPGFR